MRRADGTPKGGRPYKRDFGIPEATDQESFTDSDSRIMKRAGGGFDYSYNAQTAVDETAQLIVALGREGKAQLQIDAVQCPRTEAMHEKRASEAGQAAYRKRKWIAEPPNG